MSGGGRVSESETSAERTRDVGFPTGKQLSHEADVKSRLVHVVLFGSQGPDHLRRRYGAAYARRSQGQTEAESGRRPLPFRRPTSGGRGAKTRTATRWTVIFTGR